MTSEEEETGQYEELEREMNRAFLQHVEDAIVPAPVFVHVVHDDHHWWHAAELGMAVILDKQIVITARPGQYVPTALLELGAEVVRADLDSEEGQQDMLAAVQRVIEDNDL